MAEYGVNDNDLWDNPMVRSAMAAMSEEDVQKYKEIGEKMYGHLDFEDGRVLNQLPPPMAEAAAYLVEQLKAGLHPSMLEDKEKALLVESHGEKWYEKWRYVEGDLTEIITLKR